jgi:hypothetical protein
MVTQKRMKQLITPAAKKRTRHPTHKRILKLTFQYIVTINPLFLESSAILNYAPGRKQEPRNNSNNSQKRVFTLERSEANFS